MNKYIQALNDLDSEEPSDRITDRKLLLSCINRPSYRKYKTKVGQLKKITIEYAKLKHKYAMLLGGKKC